MNNSRPLNELVKSANTGLDAIKRAPIVEEDTGIKCARIQDISQKKTFHNWGNTKVEDRNFEKFKLLKDDFLIARTGASVGVNKLIDKDLKAVFNNGLIRIRCKEDLYPRFLYFCFQTPSYKGHINSIAYSTSTQPNMKIRDLLSIELPYFPLNEQKAIAHILGTLDDKIELNRKMNETLEEMAQALFKSWFVDFDPVLDKALASGHEIPEPLQANAEKRKALGDKRKALPQEIADLFPDRFVFTEELGWVPEGWEVKFLEDFATVKYGKDHKKLEEGSYPCYGSGGVMRHVESTLYDLPSVLIPRKGSLDNIMYVREPFWSVDTMFYTAFNNESYVKFLYYNLKLLDISGMNVGSAVPSMTTKVLNVLKILKPHDSILLKFDQILEIYYKKIEANKNQIEELTTCRDTLLPKLISGELRVPKTVKMGLND
jgi:type I restriction enzyme S subunit